MSMILPQYEAPVCVPPLDTCGCRGDKETATCCVVWQRPTTPTAFRTGLYFLQRCNIVLSDAYVHYSGLSGVLDVFCKT